MAKKLPDCGVFCVSSREYLKNDIKNRNDWESRGPEAVAEIIELIQERRNHLRVPEIPQAQCGVVN
jgi:hypothetical protein